MCFFDGFVYVFIKKNLLLPIYSDCICMPRALKRILKYLSLTLVTLLLIVLLWLSGLALWLRTDEAHQWLFQQGIGMLRDKLQTQVKADRIDIELMRGQVRIYGLSVNDREDSLLLSVNSLHAGIAPFDLLDHKVRITDIEMLGANARLKKDSTGTNFQFIIDAFKQKTPRRKKVKMQLEVDVKELNLNNVHVRWDVTDKARKNIGKPMRGAFDANHLDAYLNMRASVSQEGKDKYAINLKRLSASDVSSGFVIDELCTKAVASKERVDVNGLMLKLPHTKVEMQPFTINLKTKTIDAPFRLSADVLLQDLAQPFSPALSNFTTPLQLSTMVSGPLACLNVDDIHIQTPDKRLTLRARGCLDGIFGRKEALHLQFHDIDMKASDEMKEQIVMHFAKKMRLKMLRQMRAVGDIRYQGSLQVLYKREVFKGKLSTRFGEVNTQFAIDGTTHYMKGHADTHQFEMGQLMNIPKLGPVDCHINFDVNISSKKKRPTTPLPGGRLPIGDITARVYLATYNKVKIAREIDIKARSDGSTAQGTVWLPDISEEHSASFRYVQTDEIQDVWFSLSDNAQQLILQESVNLLSDKIQSKVEADSVNLRFFDGEARLYGVRVCDRQDKHLFSLDTLSVSLDAEQLFDYTVHVTNVGLYGLDAVLSKDSIESNFRFIIQSFQKGNKKTSAKKRLHMVMALEQLDIEDMRLKWDVVDKTRKNLDNPTRGAFDVNHVDVELDLHTAIRQMAGGGYEMDLKDINLIDYGSGLMINDISTYALWKDDILRLDNLYVKLPQSWLRAESLAFNLKKMELVEPFDVRASVVLQDIAKPFAPALANFTTPLNLQARLSGKMNGLQVDDIHINTLDTLLDITGRGVLDISAGTPLSLHFYDVDMRAENEMKLQMVMHFAKTVRLKMLRQMEQIGDIRFRGNLDILPKKEIVSGRLDTEYGYVDTEFTLDGNTHFMTGYLDTSALEMGKLMNVKNLGAVNGHIDFDFNISSKAPQPEGALPNGRLPQGHIEATINNARYKMFRTKKIEATINSNGSTATGTITLPKKIIDMIVKFKYIQTADVQHMQFRLRWKLHNIFKRKKKPHHHEHAAH